MDPVVIAAVASLAAGTALAAAGAWRGAEVLRRRRVTGYLEDVLDVAPGTAPDDEVGDRLSGPFVGRVVRPAADRVATALAAVTPGDHRARIERHLRRAGLAGVRPEEVIAAEGAGLALGLLVGLGLVALGGPGPVATVALVALLAAAGAGAPMAWLRRAVATRVEGIRRELPETLDLLAISVEAGLGLEGAMEVVVDDGTGALATEVGRTLQEMELGVSRRDALNHLRDRVQVPELGTFVQAVVQADLLGMPLARVLKIQADEMRTKRRQWARERAGKLPVKILFPLVACIFPAVLVVILGPAMSKIGQAF